MLVSLCIYADCRQRVVLAEAVAYGSLPLLASWGVQLRERTT